MKEVFVLKGAGKFKLKQKIEQNFSKIYLICGKNFFIEFPFFLVDFFLVLFTREFNLMPVITDFEIFLFASILE